MAIPTLDSRARSRARQVEGAMGNRPRRLVSALAGLMSFDNNGNGVVCWIGHPSQSTPYERDVFVANVIDDNAAPH